MSGKGPWFIWHLASDSKGCITPNNSLSRWSPSLRSPWRFLWKKVRESGQGKHHWNRYSQDREYLQACGSQLHALFFQKSAGQSQVEFWSQKTQANLLRTRRLAFIWLRHPANGIKAFKEFLGTGPHPYQQGLCSCGKVGNLYSQQPHSGGPGLKASPDCDFIKTQWGVTAPSGARVEPPRNPQEKFLMAHLTNYQAHFPLWATYLHAIVPEIK